MERIRLNWVTKFKELFSKKGITDMEILNEYMSYCIEQEDILNQRWREYNTILTLEEVDKVN